MKMQTFLICPLIYEQRSNFKHTQKIKYPGFSRDIVSFGLVQKAELHGKLAKVTLELSTADQTLPNAIKKEVEEALLADDTIEESRSPD